jgi:signal transduction histidine kinase
LIHDTAAALHLYRIAQEAVNNALKHGKPKHVWIGLAAAKEVITLTIEDDGHGVPGELAETAGMGLRIMAHRAKMIGGSVEVRPGDGKGTMVTCTYPIRSNEQEPV